MLDQEDWRCPTCLDLCFKPAANSACGHVFCFWCIHKAMSPYAPSACPICRTKYSNLPAICPKLHRFLACQFPEAYTQRREETEAEEQEIGAASPEPDAGGPLPPPDRPGHWQPQHFACDSPRCGRLLCRPLVLNCGHAVCRTCLPGCLATGSGASKAAGAGASPAGHASPAQSPGLAGGGAAYECPACGMAARQAPAVCKQLADLLAELFPEQSRQRQVECDAAEAAWQAEWAAAVPQGHALSHSAAVANPSADASTQQQQHDQEVEDEVTAEGEDRAAAAAGQQGGGAQEPRTLSPSLTAALRRRQAAGGVQSAMAERLEHSLRRLTAADEYTWHGVGCDGCGQYPILGRRYQCLDCPDAMGFDLCGACMDRGLSDIVGRFNQRHTPQHRMDAVRPRVTAMHMLQAANPEMPMEQLMWLLEMAMTPDSGPEPEPHAQQAQQAQQAQAEEEQQQGQQQGQQQAQQGPQAESNLLPVLRRGPRPAYDPHAQEPSPSAHPARRHGQQQQPPPGSGTQPAHGSAAAAAEAQGLVEDEEWGALGVTAVHVPLDRLLPGPQGRPPAPDA